MFTTQRSLEDGQAFYADMKRRAVEAGRRPEQIVILPGIVPILGSTEAEARERERAFDEQIIPEYGLFQISKYFDVDLTGAELDAPLPEVPEEEQIEGFKSRSTLVANLAHGENLTVRQLLAKLGWGRGHRSFAGHPRAARRHDRAVVQAGRGRRLQHHAAGAARATSRRSWNT